MAGVCPRKGYVVLTAPDRKMGAYETSCKSWSCLSCRKKLLSLFIERVSLGSLMDPNLYFITNTFLKEQYTTVDAIYAERVWRSFVRQMRKHYPKLMFLKVVELTKAGQPHFHSVMGGIGKVKDNCRERRKQTARHLLSPCRLSSECLEHQVKQAWWKASGDSYITLVREVYDGRGLCTYLSKYMNKDFEDFDASCDLGFKKRWTQSQNWPKLERMCLRGTFEKAWLKVDASQIKPGNAYADMICAVGESIVSREITPDDGWFERLGTLGAKKMRDEKARKVAAAMAKRIMNSLENRSYGNS